MILTILRSTSQVFNRMFHYWNLSNGFLMIKLGLWVFKRKTIKVKCQFYHFISRLHTMNMIYHCWYCLYFLFLFFKDCIYLFLDRGEGKEKERERNTNVWLPLELPLLRTWPAAQACALTGTWTDSPLVCRPTLNPLSYTSQVNSQFKTLFPSFSNNYRHILSNT